MTLDAVRARLVREASLGDRAAFGELYERYARMVHGILLLRVPVADVEDLVQDVFVTAMRQLPSLRAQDAFGGWLAAIARRRAIDHCRGLRARVELNEDSAVSGPDQLNHIEALRVLDAIRALPEAYRETLVLRFVEGLTGPEIAERTGLAPDSVRVNLFRGVRLLRERLGGRKAL